MRTRDNNKQQQHHGSESGGHRKHHHGHHSSSNRSSSSHHHQHHQHQQQHHHDNHHHQQQQHTSSGTSTTSTPTVDSTYFFPGAASLSDHIDHRVMVILRDGKKLIGTLRSYDQFANMVLEDTVERIVVEKNFGDFLLGLYMVRGENVVLMGEIDDELEQQMEQRELLRRVSLPQILQEQKEYKEAQMALLASRESAFDT